MPISKAEKEGFLQNASAMLLTANALLNEVRKNPNKKQLELLSMLVGGVAMLTITLATLTQAYVSDTEESNIMVAGKIPN